ncbi:hypothetical protein IGI04_023782 [Brassica rapa subsp. trilocularis]|uniref:Kinesin motor domain-containing protein n=1 Tax=Brassica rapa subsp. trilocularis TaxID=1813537 RepID=A0ABQ7M4V5_BRACM|nr:hypothetical protein IGI04_023782 [Brassica rapa subsp. trilocularis]
MCFLPMVDASMSLTMTEFEDKKKHMHELQDRLADTERQLFEGEVLRKKLHNTILELKGNIRVFCRLRPLLPDDGGHQEASVIAYPRSSESLGRGIDVGNKHPFTLDKVFDHGASQEEVFFIATCSKRIGWLQGSGKTYTMMGRPETPEQKGLIPRSLEQMFKTSQSLSAQGWKYKRRVSIFPRMLASFNIIVVQGLSLWS